jgi:hypothetical protein
VIDALLYSPCENAIFELFLGTDPLQAPFPIIHSMEARAADLKFGYEGESHQPAAPWQHKNKEVICRRSSFIHLGEFHLQPLVPCRKFKTTIPYMLHSFPGEFNGSFGRAGDKYRNIARKMADIILCLDGLWRFTPKPIILSRVNPVVTTVNSAFPGAVVPI